MKRVLVNFVIFNIFFILIACSTSQFENKNYSLNKSEAGGSSIIIVSSDDPEEKTDQTNFSKDLKNHITFDVTKKTSSLKISGYGKTNNKNILLKNNNIIIKHSSGFVEFNQENIELLKKESSGWSIKEGVEFRLFDNNDLELFGEITFDNNGGNIFFAPEKVLYPENRYVLFIVADNRVFETVILISFDDTKEKNSLFAGVRLRELGEYNIRELTVNDRAFYAFNFTENPVKIMLWITELENDAEVYFTLYNTYNNADNGKIYFQRWKKSGDPIKDYFWQKDSSDKSITKKILCDEEDASLDGFLGIPDYSFANVYFEMSIILKGKDITDSSEAKLNVVNYYNYMKSIKKEKQ